jgi:hypothetical protein
MGIEIVGFTLSDGANLISERLISYGEDDR